MEKNMKRSKEKKEQEENMALDSRESVNNFSDFFRHCLLHYPEDDE